LFFSGTPQQGDGKITFSPNTIQQKLPGTTIDQVKIQYDGRAPEMIQSLKERMDDNTGITPTLQGEVEGKTLGEIIHAKDSALKRLSVPLKNIAKVLEDEAYLFLSWANQVYSIPELKEFVDLKEMQDFNTEFSKEPSKVEMPLNEGDKIQAQYSPTLDLGIEQNREGNLIESPENRYVETAGRPIKWEGRIIVDVQSIVATSQELDKQRKLELFNLVFPALQAIIQFKTMGDIQGAVDLAKPIVQVLEIQDEEPENWLPVDIVEMLENPEMVKQVMAQKQQEMQAQQQASQPLMTDKASLEAMAKEQPASRPGQIGAQTVVPQNEVSNPMRQSIAQIMKPR